MSLTLTVAASPPASAAVLHEFLPVPSAKISEGVPAGSGATVQGPLVVLGAMTADSGRVWVADRLESSGNPGRVDSFNALSGEFSPPQLVEEEGVQFLGGHGVAVGHPEGEGEVYVDGGKEAKPVVAVLNPSSGKLQGVWTGANAPGGSFSTIVGVAVDGSANPETRGAVYVATHFGSPELNLKVVDVFKPKAGGAEPAEVAQLTGTPSGPFSEPEGVAVSGLNGDVLVADGNPERCSAGEGECVVDVFEPVSGMPGVYSFLFKITGAPQSPFKRIGPMAVDAGTGNIYVVEKQLNVVDEFSATGEYVGRLTGTPTGPGGVSRPFTYLESVAVDAASHHVFVGDYNQEKREGTVDVFAPGVVVPDVAVTEPVLGLTATSVTLRGTVNPREAGAATCEFELGTSTSYGQHAECEKPIANGNAKVPVQSLSVTGLQPDTTYHYRLDASNPNGVNTGECPEDCGQFTTPGPGIHSESVSNVAATSATLHASIDPHNTPTSYYFQYGKTTGYEEPPVPSPPGEAIGSGEGVVQVEHHLQGLSPSTVYHYRVLTVSEFGTFPGPDQTFTTQPGGSGFALPDGRQWELVSPPDKHGALLLPIELAGIVQSSASGGAMTYLTTAPTEEHVHGFSEEVQVMSGRGSRGWSSQDISTPHGSAVGSTVGSGQEYRFFSEDLSQALVEPFGEFTSLAPEVSPPDTERTAYLRHNSTCATTPADCFQPLLTGAPGFADVPEGTKFGGAKGLLGEGRFVGASPDLAHVVLSSGVALTSTATGANGGLYEFSAGRPAGQPLLLLSELPHSGGPAESSQLGFQGGISARHAVSDDGSRVVWSVTKGAGHLYMRDTALGQTAQLDVVQPGVPASGQAAPQFQLASRDGSRVFFTDSQRLTKGSGGFPGVPDLYECEMVAVAGELQCRLSDLTPLHAGESAAVQGGLLGASDDGSYLYFVANGILGDGSEHGAVQGDCPQSSGFTAQQACNLYMLHYDNATQKWEAPRFIRVLSGEDHPDWSSTLSVGGQTARVSPDGRWLAFMSRQSLTGYDNRDANSGQPDEEVFLFHADDGRLACASCNPTGARPTGIEYGKLKLVAGFNIWGSSGSSQTWLAANIPAWTGYELQHARYQSRYLSNSGRLFFNSSDALVPQDINNNEDVYQFEPAGTGGCAESSPAFNPVTSGCVGLISSGTAAGESAFLDASENGNDVFFLTGEKLTPQDTDSSLDIYDAHACTTESPCLQAAAPPPACVTADACRAAPAPQPSIFGSPASATFSWVGNITPPPPAGKAGPSCSSLAGAPSKACTRKQNLAKALSSCRKKYNRSKTQRAKCERQARKRYGAKQSRKAKAGH